MKRDKKSTNVINMVLPDGIGTLYDNLKLKAGKYNTLTAVSEEEIIKALKYLED